MTVKQILGLCSDGDPSGRSRALAVVEKLLAMELSCLWLMAFIYTFPLAEYEVCHCKPSPLSRLLKTPLLTRLARTNLQYPLKNEKGREGDAFIRVPVL